MRQVSERDCFDNNRYCFDSSTVPETRLVVTGEIAKPPAKIYSPAVERTNLKILSLVQSVNIHL